MRVVGHIWGGKMRQAVQKGGSIFTLAKNKGARGGPGVEVKVSKN